MATEEEVEVYYQVECCGKRLSRFTTEAEAKKVAKRFRLREHSPTEHEPKVYQVKQIAYVTEIQ